MKALQFKIGFGLWAMVCLFCVGILNPIYSQSDNKIVIVKEYVDENGNKKVERIEKTGAEADEFIQEHQTEDGMIRIDIDANESAGKSMQKEIRVMKFKSENGEEIELEGDVDWNTIQKELPADIREKIKEMNVAPGEKNVRILKLGEGSQDVDVDLRDGQYQIRIDKDGDVQEFKGAGDIPDDIRQRLEDMQIQFGTGGNCGIVQNQKFDNGNKAFMGIVMEKKVEVENGETFDSGVVITEVVKDSGAEKAGLQEGDQIKSVDNANADSMEDVIDALKGKKIGDVVLVKYVRNGQKGQASVTLQARPQKNSYAQVYKFKRGGDCYPGCCKDWKKCCDEKGNAKRDENKPYLGVTVVSIENENGVEIIDTYKEEAAAEAGLQSGDVITKIGRKEVNAHSELVEALSDYKPGEVVKVTYLRDGDRERAKVTLGAYPMTAKFDCCASGPCCSKKECPSSSCCPGSGKKEENNNISTEDLIGAPEVGTNTLELQEMNLFPNPTDGSFRLNFRSAESLPTTISVVDINGKEVYRDELRTFNGNYSEEINISANGTGIYFVNILQGDKKYTEKVVVK